MQPDHIATWDEFDARRAAETGEEPDSQLRPKHKRQEPALAVLMRVGALHQREGREVGFTPSLSFSFSI